jgi:hypothetical protein
VLLVRGLIPKNEHYILISQGVIFSQIQSEKILNIAAPKYNSKPSQIARLEVVYRAVKHGVVHYI